MRCFLGVVAAGPATRIELWWFAGKTCVLCRGWCEKSLSLRGFFFCCQLHHNVICQEITCDLNYFVTCAAALGLLGPFKFSVLTQNKCSLKWNRWQIYHYITYLLFLSSITRLWGFENDSQPFSLCSWLLLWADSDLFINFFHCANSTASAYRHKITREVKLINIVCSRFAYTSGVCSFVNCGCDSFTQQFNIDVSRKGNKLFLPLI